MNTTTKTVAERLREAVKQRQHCDVDIIGNALGRAVICDSERPCFECEAEWFNALADTIEAEQAELREKLDFNLDSFRKERDCLSDYIKKIESQSVDIAAFELLCDKLDCGSPDMQGIAKQIRKAMNGAERTKTEHDGVDVDALLKLAGYFDYAFGATDWAKRIRDAVKGAKPQLPEGIKWPRFEDGELVKIGNEVTYPDGLKHEVKQFWFEDGKYLLGDSLFGLKVGGKYGESVKRPEPEVLDADNVPIKVGDTVWYVGGGNAKTVKRIADGFVEVEESIARLFPEQLTHRKPDTFKSVVEEMLTDFDSHDTIELDGYFDRLRKLMGGE